MGYGAYMKVYNNRSTTVRTFINDVNCMYEYGGDGSHLERFNNLAIDAGRTYPEGGGAEYIEARDSGSCFFENSTFSLKVTDDRNGAIIGTISFVDSSANWDISSNSNEDVLNVNIDNSGAQARIIVTIASS